MPAPAGDRTNRACKVLVKVRRVNGRFAPAWRSNRGPRTRPGLDRIGGQDDVSISCISFYGFFPPAGRPDDNRQLAENRGQRRAYSLWRPMRANDFLLLAPCSRDLLLVPTCASAAARTGRRVAPARAMVPPVPPTRAAVRCLAPAPVRRRGAPAVVAEGSTSRVHKGIITGGFTTRTSRGRQRQAGRSTALRQPSTIPDHCMRRPTAARWSTGFHSGRLDCVFLGPAGLW